MSNGSISIYPNPVDDKLFIHLGILPKEVTKAKKTAFDVQGERGIVLSSKVQSYENLSIPIVKDLPAAVYLLAIYFDNGEQITERFNKK